MIIGLFISLAIALLMSLTFARRRGRLSALAFFVVVFLLVWNGSVWMLPFGPQWGRIYWIPYIIIGVVVSLLLLALLPEHPPRTTTEGGADAKEEASEAAGIGLFFWILVILLGTMIVVRYTLPPAVH